MDNNGKGIIWLISFLSFSNLADGIRDAVGVYRFGGMWNGGME